MRKILKRLSRFFMFILRLLTEDFGPEEKKISRKEKGGVCSERPKRNHTYNKQKKKIFESDFVEGSLRRADRRTFNFIAGKDAEDSSVIPEYLPEPDS